MALPGALDHAGQAKGLKPKAKPTSYRPPTNGTAAHARTTAPLRIHPSTRSDMAFSDPRPTPCPIPLTLPLPRRTARQPRVVIRSCCILLIVRVSNRTRGGGASASSVAWAVVHEGELPCISAVAGSRRGLGGGTKGQRSKPAAAPPHPGCVHACVSSRSPHQRRRATPTRAHAAPAIPSMPCTSK